MALWQSKIVQLMYLFVLLPGVIKSQFPCECPPMFMPPPSPQMPCCCPCTPAPSPMMFAPPLPPPQPAPCCCCPTIQLVATPPPQPPPPCCCCPTIQLVAAPPPPPPLPLPPPPPPPSAPPLIAILQPQPPPPLPPPPPQQCNCLLPMLVPCESPSPQACCCPCAPSPHQFPPQSPCCCPPPQMHMPPSPFHVQPNPCCCPCVTPPPLHPTHYDPCCPPQQQMMFSPPPSCCCCQQEPMHIPFGPQPQSFYNQPQNQFAQQLPFPMPFFQPEQGFQHQQNFMFPQQSYPQPNFMHQPSFMPFPSFPSPNFVPQHTPPAHIQKMIVDVVVDTSSNQQRPPLANTQQNNNIAPPAPFPQRVPAAQLVDLVQQDPNQRQRPQQQIVRQFQPLSNLQSVDDSISVPLSLKISVGPAHCQCPRSVTGQQQQCCCCCIEDVQHTPFAKMLKRRRRNLTFNNENAPEDGKLSNSTGNDTLFNSNNTTVNNTSEKSNEKLDFLKVMLHDDAGFISNNIRNKKKNPMRCFPCPCLTNNQATPPAQHHYAPPDNKLYNKDNTHATFSSLTQKYFALSKK